MVELTADEARVLGVLIEKALTTPEGYPLTLNALVNGCNQKNNRHPVMDMADLAVLTALNSLKAKGLVVQVDVPGGRTSKYRHETDRKLGIGKSSLALLAEMLLRGPQTLGELRGRASRMHPFESMESARGVLETLMQREEPLVRQIDPLPGSRAVRFMQLLAPEAHAVDSASAEGADLPEVPEAAAGGAAGPSLCERVESLEGQVAVLQSALRRLASALGEPDPLAEASAAESVDQDTAPGQADPPVDSIQ